MAETPRELWVINNPLELFRTVLRPDAADGYTKYVRADLADASYARGLAAGMERAAVIAETPPEFNDPHSISVERRIAKAIRAAAESAQKDGE